jgi:hypothetical protein
LVNCAPGVKEEDFPGFNKEGPLINLPKELYEKLHNAMVSIPKVDPGDSVWWHPDLIHRFVIATYKVQGDLTHLLSLELLGADTKHVVERLNRKAGILNGFDTKM